MKKYSWLRAPASIIAVLCMISLVYVQKPFLSFSKSSPDRLPHGGTGDARGLGKFRVTRVHDGDTISIRVSGFAKLPIKTERVRLIGIDAPELRQEPWGWLAKKQLKKLISESDWVVNVEFDVEQRDKYGRLLGYLWGKDGRMINETMLESGYAVLFTLPPNVKYAGRFTAVQKRAKAARAGIWSKGGLIRESPYEWRRRHPRD